MRARKAKCEASGPLVIGFNPAWIGEDRHAMAWRRGRKVEKVETRQKLDTMQAAGWVKQVIERDKPRRVFLAVGGVGAGIYDRLNEMGFGAIVRAVNFGSAPQWSTSHSYGLGRAPDSRVGACPCRRTGIHFAGTCASRRRATSTATRPAARSTGAPRCG